MLTLPESRQTSVLMMMCNIFSDDNKKIKNELHITIQGPVKEYPDKDRLLNIKNIMKYRNERLLISGIGFFKNENKQVVYLKVQGEWLKNYWYKPDYPIKEFGFNPHITLYEGVDEIKANLIFKFLSKEKIDLIVEDTEVSVKSLKQKDLFVLETEPALNNNVRGVLPSELLNRAENLIKEYNKKIYINAI